MVKQVNTRTELPLSAGLYHALRCDRGFDLYSAQQEGSNYECHKEEHSTDEHGNVMVVIESTLTYEKSAVPGPIAGLVGNEPFRVWSRFRFCRDLHDEAHLATFETKPSILSDKLFISGSVWCEHVSEQRCVLHNEVLIDARIFGVGSVIEGALASQMQATYKGLGAHTLAYLESDSFRAFVASDAPAYRRLVTGETAGTRPTGSTDESGLHDTLGASLLAAAAQGSAAEVRRGIAAGAPIDFALASDRLTPLMMACLRGHSECAALIVAANAAVDATSASGFTPLIIACERGHDRLAAWLLSVGANGAQLTPRGEGPLWWACRFGHVQCVSVLLNAAVDANQKDAVGRSPLALCARYGHLECLTALARSGAAIDAADHAGGTPLLVACEHGHPSAVEALLLARANVTASVGQGESALVRAARHGHTAVIELLLNAQAGGGLSNGGQGSGQSSPCVGPTPSVAICDHHDDGSVASRALLAACGGGHQAVGRELVRRAGAWLEGYDGPQGAADATATCLALCLAPSDNADTGGIRLAWGILAGRFAASPAAALLDASRLALAATEAAEAAAEGSEWAVGLATFGQEVDLGVSALISRMSAPAALATALFTDTAEGCRGGKRAHGGQMALAAAVTARSTWLSHPAVQQALTSRWYGRALTPIVTGCQPIANDTGTTAAALAHGLGAGLQWRRRMHALEWAARSGICILVLPVNVALALLAGCFPPLARMGMCMSGEAEGTSGHVHVHEDTSGRWGRLADATRHLVWLDALAFRYLLHWIASAFLATVLASPIPTSPPPTTSASGTELSSASPFLWWGLILCWAALAIGAEHRAAALATRPHSTTGLARGHVTWQHVELAAMSAASVTSAILVSASYWSIPITAPNGAALPWFSSLLRLIRVASLSTLLGALGLRLAALVPTVAPLVELFHSRLLPACLRWAAFAAALATALALALQYAA